MQINCRKIAAFALIFTFVLSAFDADAKRRRRRSRSRRLPIINEKKLYERLGGTQDLKKITEEWLLKAIADTKISGFDALRKDPQSQARFRSWLIDETCELSDGGCEVQELKPSERVVWQKISSTDFLSFSDHLVAVLEQRKKGEREKNELLSRWGHIDRSPDEIGPDSEVEDGYIERMKRESPNDLSDGR
jgi:hypothetical protein